MKTERKTKGKRKTPADYLHETFRITPANEADLDLAHKQTGMSKSSIINHSLSAQLPIIKANFSKRAA